MRGQNKNSNVAVGFFISATSIIKRTVLLGLLVANVFMAISLIDDDKEK